MHPTSLENMQKCHDRYFLKSQVSNKSDIKVLDIGAANFNGSYRSLFSASNIDFIGVDLEEGPGVDIVLQSPYQLPFENESIDLVISGQAFEHCEFFWASFDEMLRVLHPDGMIFLLVPSSGPEHRYPVDCYRFYPDSMTALAKWGKCHLIDVWLDERGPWKDLVGVFAKKEIAKWLRPNISFLQAGQTKIDDTAGAQNPVDHGQFPASDADAVKGSVSYLDVLSTLHKLRQPQLYLETGVRHGISLKLSNCKSIGIDPLPEIKVELDDNARIYTMASDDFFEFHAPTEVGSTPIDLAFIDGLHLFEFALRDFMNIEKYSNGNTIVIVDDVYPNNAIQAKRIRESKAWAGDVWKIYDCLREYRPDLRLELLDTFPCGSLMITGLNPANRILTDNYNPIVRRFTSPESDAPGQAVFDRSQSVRISNESLEVQLSALIGR